MNKSLLDLSGKIEGPVITVCDPIAKLVKEHKVECFVIGATARDIVISAYHGFPIRSMTNDVDFGIQVANWGDVIPALYEQNF
ncbi:MAG: hypothetical protein J5J00_12090 [Deltaproteobacteria bacterium]|nr:hypothetical protein [Deltaproteobacteria bacterium]